jgi:hypothetical protein
MNSFMILLQGCAHLGVRLQIGKHLREMFFPVKGAGSWAHVIDHDVVDAEGATKFEFFEVASEPGKMQWRGFECAFICPTNVHSPKF